MKVTRFIPLDFFWKVAVTILLILSCSGIGSAVEVPVVPEKVGILLTGHGGLTDWEAAVNDAIIPLRRFCPVEVAYGMAEPVSLQAAVDRLEAAGVTRIAVVYFFVSSQSFLRQYEYLLGLSSVPPAETDQPHSHGGRYSMGGHDAQMDMSAPLKPIRKKAAFVISQQGLYDAPVIADILVDRVRKLSVTPEKESVLILAHGVGEDAENAEWIAKIDRLADKVRKFGRFRSVWVETLREDWPEKREEPKQRIFDFVEKGNKEGGRVIVIPFRIFGFGPYKAELMGLQYVSDGHGFLPDPRVTEWIREQAAECFKRAGWPSCFGK